MAVKFCPIASGSNGNSIYVGTESTRILIDAGLSGKRIQAGLDSIGENCAGIDAIFVTHEHSDHIQGAGILSRRFNVPIYASPKTWTYINRHNALGKIEERNKCIVYQGERCVINDITVTSFDIPHDASEPVGYTVYAEGYKISVATDLGHATDTVKENICDSDILLLESNHDLEMLQNGRYPKELKSRVMGKRGHLSNVSAGQLLTEIMSKKLKYVFLGHLSEENNRPLIAFDTVSSILTANQIAVGKDLKLLLASRGAVSESLIME